MRLKNFHTADIFRLFTHLQGRHNTQNRTVGFGGERNIF